MCAWESLDLYSFACCQLLLGPVQRSHMTERQLGTRVVHHPVAAQRAVVDLAQRLDEEHQLLGRVPSVHQHSGERQAFVGNGAHQHVPDMIELGLTISLGGEHTIVDGPVLAGPGIDVKAIDNTDTADQAMDIAAVLSAHQFDLVRMVLVEDRVIENNAGVSAKLELRLNIFPNHARSQFVASDISIQRIMAEMIVVIGMISQREVYLTGQQKLAIVDPGGLQ